MLRPTTLLLMLSLLGQAPGAVSAEQATLDAPASTPAHALPPADCARLLRSARSAAMGGDPAAALAILRGAVERFPDELVALDALISLGRGGGLAEGERRQLLDLLAARLADRQRPVPIAVLQYLGRSPDADPAVLALLADRLRGELAQGGGDPALLETLADVQQRLGDQPAAVETLEQLYALTGTERLAWSLYAVNVELERWARAADLLMTMVEGGSDGLRPILVDLLARAGRSDEMMRQIEILESEGLGDLLLPYRETLAWSLYDAGRQAEAEQLFRHAAMDRPEDAGLQAVLLNLYGSDEERRARAAELATTWQLEEDPHALFEEGTQRLTVGDAAAAIDLLERAVVGLPKLEAAWYNLGLAAYRLERWERVADAFGSALGLNPRRAPSHLYRGVALVELGRCDEAVQALENALGHDPSQSLALYHLATCYRELGDTAAADDAWRRYQEGLGEGV